MREFFPVKSSPVNTCSLLYCQTTNVMCVRLIVKKSTMYLIHMTSWFWLKSLHIISVYCSETWTLFQHEVKRHTSTSSAFYSEDPMGSNCKQWRGLGCVGVEDKELKLVRSHLLWLCHVTVSMSCTTSEELLVCELVHGSLSMGWCQLHFKDTHIRTPWSVALYLTYVSLLSITDCKSGVD